MRTASGVGVACGGLGTAIAVRATVFVLQKRTTVVLQFYVVQLCGLALELR